MQRTCKNPWCSQPFEITNDDLAFYENVSPVFAGKKQLIPPPTLCPECRQQRRSIRRNERSLYKRTCSLCGKHMVAIYRQETTFPVYCSECFFSDQWDPVATGREFDPLKSFFQQFRELQDNAPRIALLSKNSENSEYTNHSSGNRNCYLSAAVFSSEDVEYSRHVFSSKQIVDCSFVLSNSELLYECEWVKNCYNSTHLIDCSSVTDCHFCIDLVGCNHCCLCSNLRNKSYCIRNIQFTRMEYEREMADCRGKWSVLQSDQEEFETMRKKHTLYRNLHLTNCQDCTGDYLIDCKNLMNCYDGSKAEDFRFCVDFSSQAQPSKDCMDCYNFNTCELLYEVHGQVNGYSNVVASFSYDVRHCCYIDNCHNCEYCFGCIGLHHKSYCILNRQYTKDDYHRLVPIIISHMRAANEWGEFFPMELSPFAYNETPAQEYFPLTKEEVLARGWKWRDQTDEMPKVDRVISAAQLPDSIDDVPDDILNRAIECEVTKRPFKIIKQELAFYRQMRLPVPRLHPDERHRRRMALRNPRKLWNRTCAKCHKPIATSYAPDRPETVYCEECYLKEVY